MPSRSLAITSGSRSRAFSGGATREVYSFQYGVETVRLAVLARELRGAGKAGPSLRIVSVRPLLDLYRIDLLLRG